jgi:chorismate mutase
MVEDLNVLRDKINDFDNSIIETMASRMEVVKKVGEFKKEHNLPLCDRKRQEEVLKMRVEQGKNGGLDEKFVKDLYNLIFNEAIRIQGEKK